MTKSPDMTHVPPCILSGLHDIRCVHHVITTHNCKYVVARVTAIIST